VTERSVVELASSPSIRILKLGLQISDIPAVRKNTADRQLPAGRVSSTKEERPITHAKVLHTQTCRTSPQYLLVSNQQVCGYSQPRNRIANHPLSLAEDHEKRCEERQGMQFGRHGSQRRRSGRLIAPERRSWVMSSSCDCDASTKAGHDLSRFPTRAVRRRQDAHLHPGTGHTDRSRHIANISHT
jgi:hypothetical protein